MVINISADHGIKNQLKTFVGGIIKSLRYLKSNFAEIDKLSRTKILP